MDLEVGRLDSRAVGAPLADNSRPERHMEVLGNGSRFVIEGDGWTHTRFECCRVC